MVSKKIKNIKEAFICWLCGYVQSSTVDNKTMRDVECPNCKLKAAFLPRPAIGV